MIIQGPQNVDMLEPVSSTVSFPMWNGLLQVWHLKQVGHQLNSNGFQLMVRWTSFVCLSLIKTKTKHEWVVYIIVFLFMLIIFLVMFMQNTHEFCHHSKPSHFRGCQFHYTFRSVSSKWSQKKFETIHFQAFDHCDEKIPLAHIRLLLRCTFWAVKIKALPNLQQRPSVLFKRKKSKWWAQMTRTF